MNVNNPIIGPHPQIDEESVRKGLHKMEIGEVSGTSGIVLKMLVAFDYAGIKWMTNFFNKIIARTRHQKTVIPVILWTVLRIRGIQLNEETTEGQSYQNELWRSLKELSNKKSERWLT